MTESSKSLEATTLGELEKFQCAVLGNDDIPQVGVTFARSQKGGVVGKEGVVGTARARVDSHPLDH